MQQDLFYKQQEFAQAYQLGSLEAEYAIDPRKILANFVFILVFAILAPPILLGITHTATNPVNFIIPSLIFFTFLGGAILLGFYFYYRYLQRTAQKAPFFHKTGMNGRSFRAGWDGDALGSRLVAEESVQGWRGFAVPAVKRKKERKARHSHVLE